MNDVLTQWNSLSAIAAAAEVLPCCGSREWAEKLAAMRPIEDEAALLAGSASVWNSLPEEAWEQAFDSHPRIGERKPQKEATEESLRASAQEQSAALSSDDAAKLALQEANRWYEQKFGRIFIICAMGRSAAEILEALHARMSHDDATEMRCAAEEQRQITELRLKRWLGGR